MNTIENAFLAQHNAVKIALDGGTTSNLAWQSKKQEAQNYIDKGYSLFWEMDLELFSNTQFSLSNQAQYLSLGFALDHFRQSIWTEFHQHTCGLSLYRGSLDFSRSFHWDEEQADNLQQWLAMSLDIEVLNQRLGIQITDFSEIRSEHLLCCVAGQRLLRMFCCDIAIDYIRLLLSFLPAGLAIFLIFDASSIKSPLESALLLAKERYGRIQIIVESYPFLVETGQKTRLGICLPSGILARRFAYQELEYIIDWLIRQTVPFRLLSEHSLTFDWDGLDELLIVSEGISTQGIRKLQGFCAAGGKVMTVGDKNLGFPQGIFNRPLA